MSLLPVSCNHLGYFFQTQIIKPYRKFNPGVFTLKNMKIRYQKGSREIEICDGKNNVYRSKMKHCCVRFLAACGFTIFTLNYVMVDKQKFDKTDRFR